METEKETKRHLWHRFNKCCKKVEFSQLLNFQLPHHKNVNSKLRNIRGHKFDMVYEIYK